MNNEIKAKPKFNSIKLRVYNLLASKQLVTAHIACLIGSGQLHSTPAAVPGGCSWYWHLQNTDVFCFSWPALSPTASHGL